MWCLTKCYCSSSCFIHIYEYIFCVIFSFIYCPILSVFPQKPNVLNIAESSSKHVIGYRVQLGHCAYGYILATTAVYFPLLLLLGLGIICGLILGLGACGPLELWSTGASAISTNHPTERRWRWLSHLKL